MPQPNPPQSPAKGGAPAVPRSIPSGVVLAAMRVVLALLFVVWLGLAQPGSVPDWHPVIALFTVYLAAALGMAAVAWRSWWLEHRLAGMAFAFDVMTALTGLYLTRAVMLDFFSAFMALFAFLMLTSAARWSGRNMLLIVIGLAVCFLLVGWLVDEGGQFFHMTKFIRRFSTLVLLLAMLGWFARNRRSVAAARYHRHGEDDPLDAALAYAMAATGAAGGVIAWVSRGETQPQLAGAGPAELPPSPLSLPADDLARPFLFDGPRRLSLGYDHRLTAQNHASPCALASGFGVARGLSIALSSRNGRGQMVLWGTSHLNTDDLLAAPGIAREVAAAIDEAETEALAREVAMSRLRGQIATDLHDSVVQTLAGARYRLEALNADAHEAAADEISLITAAIAAEQRHLRSIITQLRQGQIQPGQRDLYNEAVALAEHLSRQWAACVTVAPRRYGLVGTAAQNFAVQQMIREGIANAVRHGGASTISIALDIAGNQLTLTITDNGLGFAPDARPRSIAHRANTLRGGLTVASQPGHSSVTVTWPLEPDT